METMGVFVPTRLLAIVIEVFRPNTNCDAIAHLLTHHLRHHPPVHILQLAQMFPLRLDFCWIIAGNDNGNLLVYVDCAERSEAKRIRIE